METTLPFSDPITRNREIVRKYQNGQTTYDLSAEYGLSHQGISHILRTMGQSARTRILRNSFAKRERTMDLDSDMEYIGTVVRLFRLAAGMTQAQLATAVGVGPQYICNLENGSIDPKYTILRRVAWTLRDYKVGTELFPDFEPGSVEFRDGRSPRPPRGPLYDVKEVESEDGSDDTYARLVCGHRVRIRRHPDGSTQSKAHCPECLHRGRDAV